MRLIHTIDTTLCIYLGPDYMRRASLVATAVKRTDRLFRDLGYWRVHMQNLSAVLKRRLGLMHTRSFCQQCYQKCSVEGGGVGDYYNRKHEEFIVDLRSGIWFGR